MRTQNRTSVGSFRQCVALALIANVFCMQHQTVHAQAHARPAQRQISGTQHLLSPGGSWQLILDQIKPGDEVILMPGAHEPIVLHSLHGEPDKPIIVRGLDPNDPPIIRGAEVGLILRDSRWVHVQDLIIDRPRRAGVIIESTRSADMTEPVRANIRLHNVTIRDVGLERAGERPTIQIDATSQVAITECRIQGWSGSGVDIIASRDVTLSGCSFIGNPLAVQTSALRIRGGSETVRIERSSFHQAGIDTALLVGGATEPDLFLPPLQSQDERAAGNRRFEARNVTIDRCTFVDQPCPIIFAHADRATVSNNTFVRPQRYVMAALQASELELIAPNRYVTFGQNLVVWDAGRLSGLLLLDQHNREVGLVFEQNLWWSDDPSTVRQRMIPGIAQLQFPQVLDVDPELDDDLRATVTAAQHFGSGGLAQTAAAK